MSATRRICLAWLAAALLMVAAARKAEADLLWGVNGHPLVSYPGVSVEQQLDYLRQLGMTSYRVDISRERQLPRLIALVRRAKARGIAILPVITPAFKLDSETPEELYRKARGLAVRLISPLQRDVRVWELGNELENYAIIRACERQDDGRQYNCAWGPAGGVGPLEYYGPRWAKVSAVLKGLSDGATSVDPSIRKAMGTAGWGHTGAFARMAQDGIKWDISVWHMYGQDPEWAFKILAGYQRPIWVTEFNHPGGGRRSAQEQADGLVRAMTRLRQLQRTYNVEAAHVYELMDESYWAPSSEAFMGLVTLVKSAEGRWMPGARKPAFVAVKELIANTPPASLASDCHLNPFNRLSSAVSMQVSYAYCLLLQRPVDGAGFKAWTEALEKGVPVTRMLKAMASSEEFRTKHAVSRLGNSELIAMLHRLLVLREPDGEVHGAYLSKLENGTLTRAAAAAAIIDSGQFRARHPLLFAPERQSGKTSRGSRECDLAAFDTANPEPENRAAYAFCLVLERPADGAGLQGWARSLRKGQTSAQMLLAMLGSSEFRDKHRVAALDNAGFVALLYRFLLDREPDQAGLAAYVSQLEAGTLSRADLPSRIMASAEFGARHPLLRAARQPAKSRPE
jgi:hypothetical protein